MNQETKKHTEDNWHKQTTPRLPNYNQTNTKAAWWKLQEEKLKYTQTDETWNELPGKMKPVC